MESQTRPRTILTSASTYPSSRTTGRRRIVRRRLSDYEVVQHWHRDRKAIKAATIVLCYANGLVPDPDNLKRARNSLYQWTRNHHTLYKDRPLSEVLYWQIQTAMLAGTKLFAIAYTNKKPYLTLSDHIMPPESVNRLAQLYWEQKVEPWYESTR